ncbi:MAG TPA: GGDEF domain-containing protein, partial [Pseudidiomarina sp.]|nr:GGDEF domain-containing protein [Pseudidiomarina sp.]
LVLIGVGATFLMLMARMQKNLSRISATDALTGFYKRDQVTDILQQQMTLAQKQKQPLSLVILDLDSFKSVNDKYGYMVGDQVLQETAQRIKRIARPQDILVRSNGAALIVIFPNTPLKLAAELTSGMLDVMRNEPFAIKSLMMTITASAGVAQWQPSQSWGQWLEQADSAMDRAKSGGRNRMKVAR